MMIACHHPNFMPWPGLFFKGMQAEQLVLLDDVQFPLGGSWINRNRLKNDQGELWLTVPVWKRGRSFQRIDQVEICNDENWQKKHLFSLEHAYKHAPQQTEAKPCRAEPRDFRLLAARLGNSSTFCAQLNLCHRDQWFPTAGGYL
jgi:hypothetical protein